MKFRVNCYEFESESLIQIHFTTDLINELTNFDKLVNSLKYIVERVNFSDKYVLFYQKFGRVSPIILTNQNLQLKKKPHI